LIRRIPFEKTRVAAHFSNYSFTLFKALRQGSLSKEGACLFKSAFHGALLFRLFGKPANDELVPTKPLLLEYVLTSG